MLLGLRRRSGHAENRNVWRYDLGGMAWQFEIEPILALVSFCARQADISEWPSDDAHTGEVDSIISANLRVGSRHKVRHWGCGARKRVSSVLSTDYII